MPVIGSSQFNYNIAIGLRSAVFVRSGRSLTVGWKYHHLSNNHQAHFNPRTWIRASFYVGVARYYRPKQRRTSASILGRDEIRVRESCRAFARPFCTASNSFNTPRSLRESSAFAPSDFASFGLSWTSMNTPSTPAATAARASTRDEFRLAAAGGVAVFVSVRSRGQLHGVRSVEDHRRKLPHDGQRAHIDDQVVVAETRSALGDEHSLVARGVALFDGVLHVPGRDELALLDVDHALAQGRGDDQVGLAAEESGDLQDVGDFGDGGDVCRLRARR